MQEVLCGFFFKNSKQKDFDTQLYYLSIWGEGELTKALDSTFQ